MSKELWILAEKENETVATSYYELLSKVKGIYDGTVFEPIYVAVTLGENDSVNDELLKSGADKVICITNAVLNEYNPTDYTEAIAEIAKEKEPEIILVPASATGSEVGPSVAAKLQTGLAAHCTDLRLDAEGTLHMMIPAFGGKLMGDDIVPTARPIMASVKPGVFERNTVSEKSAELVMISAHLSENTGIRLVKSESIETGKRPIDKAEIIQCAGHGAGSEETIADLEAVAEKLGVSLGYTRPLVDLGFFNDESAMIGTSGKTVKPKLYIGFGVSGASHHVCGMKDSRMIININNDADADCFTISDYKAVADCKAVIKELRNQTNA